MLRSEDLAKAEDVLPASTTFSAKNFDDFENICFSSDFDSETSFGVSVNAKVDSGLSLAALNEGVFLLDTSLKSEEFDEISAACLIGILKHVSLEKSPEKFELHRFELPSTRSAEISEEGV